MEETPGRSDASRWFTLPIVRHVPCAWTPAITTHCSQPELANLIAAADRICATDSRKIPATTWLRRKSNVVFARKGLLKRNFGAPGERNFKPI